MTQHEFSTPHPVDLIVEFGKGMLSVIASDTGQTDVTIAGDTAADVTVTQAEDRISIIAPRQRTGFLGRDTALRIRVELPTGSVLATKTGSADIEVTGRLGGARIRSGSGQVTLENVDGPLEIDTGSGDIDITDVAGQCGIKSGSGDVLIHTARGAAVVSTGSGDVRLDSAHGRVAIKTGSGDVRIDDAYDGLSAATGSGDLTLRRTHRGEVAYKTASGEAQVGVVAGIPVWTDISSVSGEIDSTLSGAGEPETGALYVELRLSTVSGDITLTDA